MMRERVFEQKTPVKSSYILTGLNKLTMTNTCIISLKQHTLWGQLLAPLGRVAAVYNTSIRGDFTPSMEQAPSG
jgi:hypothetical protein